MRSCSTDKSLFQRSANAALACISGHHCCQHSCGALELTNRCPSESRLRRFQEEVFDAPMRSLDSMFERMSRDFSPFTESPSALLPRMIKPPNMELTQKSMEDAAEKFKARGYDVSVSQTVGDDGSKSVTMTASYSSPTVKKSESVKVTTGGNLREKGMSENLCF